MTSPCHSTFIYAAPPPQPPSIVSHTHRPRYTTTFFLPFTSNFTQTDTFCLYNMVRPLTKVVYQPDSTLTNEYVLLVNPDEVRWYSIAYKMHMLT